MDGQGSGRVYIGNLPADYTEKDVQKEFETFGSIVKIDLKKAVRRCRKAVTVSCSRRQLLPVLLATLVATSSRLLAGQWEWVLLRRVRGPAGRARCDRANARTAACARQGCSPTSC